MVLPRENRIRGATVEEVMWEKISAMQEAREFKDGEQFDELSNSLEKLFRAFPKALEELQEAHQQLEQVMYQEKVKMVREADGAPDVIEREKFIGDESYSMEWEFRNMYEEVILDIMQKHDLIPMSRPHFTDMSVMRNVNEPQPQIQPTQPQPQLQPPHPQPIQPVQPQQFVPVQPAPMEQSQPIQPQGQIPIPSKPKEKKAPRISAKRKSFSV